MYRDSDQRDFARRLRNQPTGAEKRLWYLLRARQLGGHKFRRQAALGPYIVTDQKAFTGGSSPAGNVIV